MSCTVIFLFPVQDFPFFRIYMAAFTPAEDILFILKFDPSLLEEALSGGEVA